jgi:hypothetical protein
MTASGRITPGAPICKAVGLREEHPELAAVAAAAL